MDSGNNGLNMKDLITKLIDEIGPGHMGSTAYDTAWAARLGEIDWDLSSHALNLAGRKSTRRTAPGVRQRQCTIMTACSAR